ncbi:hypothetical protein [Nocardia wallacei]|uniref:hypothetical protein n=1 Tax=Nocardia wallacei TaxID=480035 RepID=UPI0024583F27|nr:hypothetical protein [Nocardia wallacei]
MAINKIENPEATACLRWVSPEQGGRQTGPPTAPVYTTTAVFRLGGEEETQPGWPAQSNQAISILIERTGEDCDDGELVTIGFLAPDLARPYLHSGAEILVLEGPKVVAVMLVREVADSASEAK